MITPFCPECKKPIPANAPAGLCPDCLLVQGIAGASNSAAFAVTTPQNGRVAVPAATAVAKYFPQLDMLELLGHGGMGAVYKARQTKLDRMVAVKIIRPETTGDPAFAERFMREARTLARLNHPGIVAVHDFGEIDAPELAGGTSPQSASRTLFYFIMEYVDGANLRQLMQAGQLSPELAVNIVPQVCEALQFAHDEGVVHRDIKPENILLDSKGRVKIADFGLAKIAGRTVDEWTLTGTHQVMGTPRYMAPEQMAGSRTIDHRADIYSLGVVFYEMLTGTVPVGHFALPSQKSKVDVRLDEVVLRAMASEPERRFQAARDLRSSVEQISSPSVKPAPQSNAPVGHSHDTGFSTIIDREVLGAWRLVAGGSEKTAAKSETFPVMLMLLLCLIGGLGTLLPWFDVVFVRNPVSVFAAGGMPLSEIAGTFTFCQDRPEAAAVLPAPDAPANQPDRNHPGAIPWDPAQVYQCNGIDLRTGIMAALVFGCIGLLWLFVPRRYQVSVPVNSAAAFLATLALQTTLLARMEIQNVRFHLPVNAAPDLPEALARTQHQDSQYAFCMLLQSAEGSGENFPPEYRQQISLTPGYFLPLGMASILLLLSGSGLRRAVFGEVSQPAQESSRGDIVVVGVKDVAAGRLPDICMVCGEHTTERVKTTISYQSKPAQAAMMLGFILGGIPGVVIAILTNHETPVACPLCARHRNHWSRLTIFASIGWMIPILLAGLGGLIGSLTGNPGLTNRPVTAAGIGLMTGLVCGLAIYLIPVIYLCCTVVKCEQTSDDHISFNRVSSAFARAARNQST